MGLTIGPLHVRRSVFIEADAARVWREFATFERIRGWLDRGHTLHRFEPRLGGFAAFSVEIDGVRHRFGGKVTVFDAECELSFESNWEGPLAWAVPTFWTIRLTRLYDGTLVELFHHGFERLGRDAADQLTGYEQGWDAKHLVALREIVNRAA
jgi:uncharacterized protein YndB with AHSA1/START domain